MASVLIGIVLVVSLVAFVGLWALIEAETSNPPVMDREEAERRAIEQGGRENAATPEAGDGQDEQREEYDDDGRVGWDD